MDDQSKSDPSFGSTSNSIDEAAKAAADHLARDVIGFVNKHLGFVAHDAQVAFLQELCIYMVERDIKILKHGRDLAIKELTNEILYRAPGNPR